MRLKSADGRVRRSRAAGGLPPAVRGNSIGPHVLQETGRRQSARDPALARATSLMSPKGPSQRGRRRPGAVDLTPHRPLVFAWLRARVGAHEGGILYAGHPDALVRRAWSVYLGLIRVNPLTQELDQ